MPATLKENPLTSGTPQTLLPQPCALVIFGAAGDLAWRKLLPAIYNLNADGELPSNFAVVGFGIGSKGDPEEWLRARAREGIEHFSRQRLAENHWNDISRALFYVEGSFNDARAYEQLKAKLDAVDRQFGIPGNRVFYLAIPPSFVDAAVSHLKQAGMVRQSNGDVFTRVIVEKPIGRDLASAREINDSVAAAFAESQTYRIDHYLGKETVQNMMVLRFANSIFEPLWTSKYVDHVQITVAEEEGVGSRVGYYEGVGALRDMVQNHLLQVLCLTAMEPPFSLDAEVVRDAKMGVLNCLRRLTLEEVDRTVVRAQYISGEIHGQQVPGYRREVSDFFEKMKKPIPADSTTETYVAAKVFIDNWRWEGVPFYLRTGKRMPKRASEVAIQFKEVPKILFNTHPEAPLETDVLSIRLAPEESMSLRIASKLPGAKVRIYPVKMEFDYNRSFGSHSPEAYERLVLDVMAGDSTLFMRRDAVEAAWHWVAPILDTWENRRERYLPEYRAGTWGPVEADRMIANDERQWRTL
jgi:glucose-6-phosphate 1-dehydrogenase